ncbi:MAG TPA: primosomal protein N' [bacterium]|nr:primosomal protein N' [bacterium]
MKKKPKLVEVAVDARLNAPLTYALPGTMDPADLAGRRVIVPLGKRKVTGYVIGFPESAPVAPAALKEVLSVLDPEPLFDPAMLKLFRFAARYYFRPLGEVIKAALPAGINTASRRVVTMTGAGAALLTTADADATDDGDEEPKLTSEELALLESIFRDGPIEADKLIGGAAALSRACYRRLLDLGLISEDQALARARVSEKTETALVLDRAPNDDDLAALSRRAPAQARLLRELAQKGCVTLKDLRERYPDPARIGRALAGAGLAKMVKLRACRDPFSLVLPLAPPPETLMPEQEEAVAAVSAALAAREFRVFMLQGVTGSGKTEVYLRSIARAAELGRGAIMLVPEIALTPQLISRFRQKFPAETTAVLHSALTPGERHDEWWRIRRGQASIVIGARSALFAPVKDLGVIVVDEEQDPAYKQDRGFMYNARDLAVMRGKEERAAVVLGSATPSMESAHRGRAQGGYTVLHLPRRVDGCFMPGVELVDLRALKNAPSAASITELKVRDRDRLAAAELLSPPLRDAIGQVLSRGEQAVLFLNRRGIASFLVCFDCGRRFVCPNCAVSLTRHGAPTAGKVDHFYGEPGNGYLLCHYCGYHEPVPRVCPQCRGVRVFPFGVGTEQMEAVTAEAFPSARVMRMDSDVMTGRESYFRLLDRVFRREVDIVVGTQMVAKGHDLPGVTLVGVLLADVSLNVPDFRAGERTFQMLTQVAGRAGRGAAPGRVIIQTFQPDHYAIRLAVHNDFETFYEEELKMREALWYPPFARLANLRISGLQDEAVKKAATLAGSAARGRARSKIFRDRVRILGPARAPIARIKGKSRWMMMIKADTPQIMSAFCETLSASLRDKSVPASVRVEIDRDPVFLL